MSNMVEVIRKIAENEIKKLHIAEIGVVTSIFPHSNDGDKENYECNVRLKYRDLELRKVAVATQHIGLANVPNIGDLVLVTFVNGNINAPVIIGRLYTDEERPPVSHEEEIVYIPPYSKGSGLRRLHMEFASGMILSITDEYATIKAGKTTLTLNCDGDVAIESSAKISVQASGDLSFTAQNITMESKQNMELKAGGGDLSMTAVNLKSESQGSSEFKANGPLTIEGTSTAELKANTQLTVQSGGIVQIKGGLVNIQ